MLSDTLELSPAAKVRSLTFLNEAGDQTLTWSADRDEEIKAIIEQKLAEGMAFYIVDPVAVEQPKRPKKLKDFEQALEKRALLIKDKDFAKFVGLGKAGVTKTPAGSRTGARRSKDAGEIASSQSVATKQRRGG
jgi:hypothetical protein